MVPRTIVMLDELPHNANGKVDRTHLPEPSDREVPFVAPRTSWEEVVAGVWCEALGVDRVGRDDDFFTLGGDSLAVEEVISALSTDYGVTFWSEAFIEQRTLGAFAERVRRPSPRHSPVCVPLRSSGSRAPLFICAGGGGLAVSFVPLARHLDDQQPVYGLQTHGLEGRGLPDFSIERIAQRYVRSIQRVQPHGPYYLAGHSAGGLFAFEVARQLTSRHGEEVRLLVLFDPVAPGWGADAHQLRRSFYGDSARPSGSHAGGTTAAPRRGVRQFAHGALRRETLSNGVAFGRRAARTVLENAQLTPMAMAVKEGLFARSDIGHFELYFLYAKYLIERYHPEPWDGRVIIYVASEGELQAKPEDWSPYLRCPAPSYPRPGDHVRMVRYPHAESLAAHVQERLDETRVLHPVYA
jgi:thioesterase domain-containing protein